MHPSPDRLYNRLNEKDTEELLRIWKEDDRETWQPDAYDVIEEILYQRLGKLPEKKVVRDLADLETENELYYSPERMMKFGVWVKVFSYLGFLLPVIEEILKWPHPYYLLQGIVTNIPDFMPVLIGFLIAAGKGIIYCTLLLAFSEGIFLLMDVEENTRSRAK